MWACGWIGGKKSRRLPAIHPVNCNDVDNATLGDDALLGDDATLGDDAQLGNNTTLGDDALLGDDATPGYHTSLDDNATLGDHALLGDNAALGNKAALGDNALGDDSTRGGIAAEHCNDMLLTTAADNDAERDGVDNRSSVEVVRVVVVPQLRGHEGRQRWKDTTQD